MNRRAKKYRRNETTTDFIDLEEIGGKIFVDGLQWARKFDLEECAINYRKNKINLFITSIGADKEVRAYGYLLAKYHLGFSKCYCFNIFDYRFSLPSNFIRYILSKIIGIFKPRRTNDQLSRDVFSCVFENEPFPEEYKQGLLKFKDKCDKENIGILFINFEKGKLLHERIIDLAEHSTRIICTSSEINKEIESAITRKKVIGEGFNLFSHYVIPQMDYISYSFLASQKMPAGGFHYLGQNHIAIDLTWLDYHNHKELFNQFLLESQKPFYPHSYLLSNSKIDLIDELEFISDIDKYSEKQRLLDDSGYYKKIYDDYCKPIIDNISENDKLLVAIMSLLPFTICEHNFDFMCRELDIAKHKELKKILLMHEILFKSFPYRYLNLEIERDISEALGLKEDCYFGDFKAFKMFYEQNKAKDSPFPDFNSIVKAYILGYSASNGIDALIKNSAANRYLYINGYYMPEMIRNCMQQNLSANVLARAHDVSLSIFKNINERNGCDVSSCLLNKISGNFNCEASICDYVYVLCRHKGQLDMINKYTNAITYNKKNDNSLEIDYNSIVFHNKFTIKMSINYLNNGYLSIKYHMNIPHFISPLFLSPDKNKNHFAIVKDESK